jgi:hypothetical protein
MIMQRCDYTGGGKEIEFRLIRSPGGDMLPLATGLDAESAVLARPGAFVQNAGARRPLNLRSPRDPGKRPR